MKNLKLRKGYALYILLGVVLFGAVGCNSVTEGEIVEKWYEPENSYVAIMPMMISNGKTTTTMMIPYYIYDGEDYCIKIKGIDKKGKERTKTLYVRRERWQDLDKGQYFCIDGDCSEDDFTYKKEKGRD
jgi:NADPH-dependent 2,4-dienoyl-CoA reductase/sulfur reductase-like enzyme